MVSLPAGRIRHPAKQAWLGHNVGHWLTQNHAKECNLPTHYAGKDKKERYYQEQVKALNKPNLSLPERLQMIQRGDIGFIIYIGAQASGTL